MIFLNHLPGLVPRPPASAKASAEQLTAKVHHLVGCATMADPTRTSGSFSPVSCRCLYYIDHRNLWLDFRILLATAPHVFRVPEQTIARVFGFPRISSQRAAESSAATVASFLTAPVQPHLSEACNSIGSSAPP